MQLIRDPLPWPISAQSLRGRTIPTTPPRRKEDIRMSATNLVRLGFLSVLLGGAAVLVAASPAAAPTLADSTSSNSVVSASHIPTVPTSSSPARLAAANTNGSSLAGTLKLQAGSCAGGETGSYFRMILPGKTANGPDSSYISNGNSTCSDETYT